MFSFPREIGLRRRPCNTRKEFNTYVHNLNGKANIYTSLFHFERPHPTKPWKYDPDSVVMDRAWFDFDTTADTTIDDVKKDVHTLIGRLSGDVRVVATGRGFHVHQLFEKPVKGQSIAPHIIRYQNKIASGLKTLDGVGNPQKLTRVPGTYNVTRQRWAVNIDLDAFKGDPFGYVIPSRPDEKLRDSDPFRGAETASNFNIVKWVSENPVKHERNVVSLEDFEGEIGCMGEVPIPPCLNKLMRHENPRHEVRVALVQYLADSLRWFAPPENFNARETYDMAEEITSFIETLGWRDFNRQITKSQVLSLLKYAHIPSTDWFRTRNLCSGPCWLHD